MNKPIVLLIVLTLSQAPAFLIMRIAVQEIAPITLGLYRVVPAAIFLFFVAIARKIDLRISKESIVFLLIMGLFGSALPFAARNWSQQYIESSLGAILNATSPLFTLITLIAVAKKEKIKGHEVLGILLGLIGVIVLSSFSPNSTNTYIIEGILMVLLASIFYGGFIVFAKLKLVDMNSIVAAFYQLLFASVYLFILSYCIEGESALITPSLKTSFLVLFLGLMSTGYAYVLYYQLLKKAGAVYLSTSAYLMPVLATILGVLVLNETIGWHTLTGCLLILLSISLCQK